MRFVTAAVLLMLAGSRSPAAAQDRVDPDHSRDAQAMNDQVEHGGIVRVDKDQDRACGGGAGKAAGEGDAESAFGVGTPKHQDQERREGDSAADDHQQAFLCLGPSFAP